LELALELVDIVSLMSLIKIILFLIIPSMPRSLETLFFRVDLQIKIGVVSNLNLLNKVDFTGYELSDIKKVNSEWYSMLEKEMNYNTQFSRVLS